MNALSAFLLRSWLLALPWVLKGLVVAEAALLTKLSSAWLQASKPQRAKIGGGALPTSQAKQQQQSKRKRGR